MRVVGEAAGVTLQARQAGEDAAERLEERTSELCRPCQRHAGQHAAEQELKRLIFKLDREFGQRNAIGSAQIHSTRVTTVPEPGMGPTSSRFGAT